MIEEPQKRVLELAALLCDELITAEQFAELDELLSSNREAREAYRGFLALHQRLEDGALEANDAAATTEPLAAKPEPGGDVVFRAVGVAPGLAKLESRVRKAGRRAVWSMAACVVVSLLVLVLLFRPNPEPRAAQSGTDADSVGKPRATERKQEKVAAIERSIRARENHFLSTDLAPPPAPPPPAAPGGKGASVEAVADADQTEESNGGFLIRDAAINDVFEMLAKRAGRQYFHNAKVAGSEFKVRGHLNEGDPLQQMEELAFMHGLRLHQKGNTVYALNGEQLNRLQDLERKGKALAQQAAAPPPVTGSVSGGAGADWREPALAGDPSSGRSSIPGAKVNKEESQNPIVLSRRREFQGVRPPELRSGNDDEVIPPNIRADPESDALGVQDSGRLATLEKEIAETNRDLRELQFRVDTHSESSRPIRGLLSRGGDQREAKAHPLLPPRESKDRSGGLGTSSSDLENGRNHWSIQPQPKSAPPLAGTTVDHEKGFESAETEGRKRGGETRQGLKKRVQVAHGDPFVPVGSLTVHPTSTQPAVTSLGKQADGFSWGDVPIAGGVFASKAATDGRIALDRLASRKGAAPSGASNTGGLWYNSLSGELPTREDHEAENAEFFPLSNSSDSGLVLTRDNPQEEATAEAPGRETGWRFEYARPEAKGETALDDDARRALKIDGEQATGQGQAQGRPVPIRRAPIVIRTAKETELSNQVTEEVRYSVDQRDAVGDPAKTRAMGVTQTSNPTLITGDNEQTTISLLDRVPIITTTIEESEVRKKAKEKRERELELQRELRALSDLEKNARTEPYSTFSLNVSDVSFKLAKAALARGEWPAADQVRVEEFVNAFDYGDPAPSQTEKVACNLEQAAHPFLQQRNLLRVSMRTAALGRSADTPLRLTVLLDNSGSMERADREESVKNALRLLASQLNPQDQVTLIGFARTPRLLADRLAGNRIAELAKVVESTPSEGGTNLEQALELGIAKAKEQMLEGGQNRIILLTDGAANLGNAKPADLARLVETMRQQGIAFDACGVGAEGLNDDILESLTRKGDGRYYFLDRPEDADEGFARQIAGALRPAARNVKIQMKFNPKRVGRYKLSGFEKHRLKKEDFRNDSVDAAELAAEEAGNAIYQIEVLPEGSGEIGTVSVRFQDTESGRMIEREWTIPYDARVPRLEDSAASLRLAAGAALLGEKLKGSLIGESVEMARLGKLMNGLTGDFPAAERVKELVQMANKVRELRGE